MMDLKNSPIAHDGVLYVSTRAFSSHESHLVCLAAKETRRPTQQWRRSSKMPNRRATDLVRSQPFFALNNSFTPLSQARHARR